jgi:hypothetical protein
MTPPPDSGAPAAPSTRTLAVTTAAAIAAAAVILVTIVLPAEYNVDPLGTGRALGLTRLSAPAAPDPVPVPAGQKLVPVQQGPAAVYHAGFKTNTVRLELGPYDFVEYKYHLEKGAAMVYSWKGTAALIHEFHGEADGTTETPISYEKKDLGEQSGAFTAPFSGIHGWYWENPGGSPITITLTTAGYYTAATEFRSDRTRHLHELTDPVGPAPVLPK